MPNATDAVFAYASVQFPHLLTPYLSQLFTTLPNDTSYYAHWPWRGADENERVRLRQILAGDAPTDLQQRAWHCLLHAADLSDVELLVEKYEVAGLDVPVEALLEEVAIDQRTTPPRRLTPLVPHQVTFPDGFFTEKRPAWIAHENHPTWAAPLPAESSEVRFGGTVPGRQCSNCNRELCYLLEVPGAATAVLNAGDPIHLATCLSCLGWETAPMFFEHDDAGLPTALAVPEDAAEPEFPASPFDRATVRVAPSQARWATQDWGLANSRENLNRIGGAPSWIQSAQYPDCPNCNERMPFVAQMDSDLTHPDSGEWLWGSGARPAASLPTSGSAPNPSLTPGPPPEPLLSLAKPDWVADPAAIVTMRRADTPA